MKVEVEAAPPRQPKVPRIGEIKSVGEVLKIHERHALAMGSIDVSACWNTLGRLVRRDCAQRDWLRGELRRSTVLQPLLDSTHEQLQSFKAREVAITCVV